MALGIVLFLFALILAIFLHEGGHFVSAKHFGMRVERFFLGFGPTIWSFRRGETEYGIKAFPVGGFCKIAGMGAGDDELGFLERDRGAPAPGAGGWPGGTGGRAVATRPRAAGTGLETASRPGQIPVGGSDFRDKPAWQRAIVLAAGSITHFAVALLLIYVVLVAIGVPIATTGVHAVVSTAPSGAPAPARAAGLAAGDVIVAVDGRQVHTFDELRAALRGTAGRRVRLVYERDGRRVTTTVVPVPAARGSTFGFIGIESAQGDQRSNLLAAIPGTFRVFGDLVAGSFAGMRDIVSGIEDRLRPGAGPPVTRPPAGSTAPATGGGTSSGGGSSGVVGLVGITRFAGQAVAASDWVGFLLIIISFNVFVGIANLLPLPPLDGGYLALLGWESVTGRAVDLRKVVPVALAIVLVLGTLTVALLYLDIVNPVSNPFR